MARTEGDRSAQIVVGFDHGGGERSYDRSMTSDDSRVLDPDRVARRTFATAFRGFDQDEVRNFLDSLAASLRAQSTIQSAATGEVERLKRERAELSASVARLESEVASLTERLNEAEEAQTEATTTGGADVDLGSLDEAALTQLLGVETVRVLETARTSARDITTRAEQEAADRLAALAERQAEVEAEVAEKLAGAENAAKEQVSAATTEAERLQAESKAAAEKFRAEEDAALALLRSNAEEEIAALKEQAVSDAAHIRAAAEKASTGLRSDAETEASRLRAEADADARASQDSARETARQMLTEAQVVREKVLSDLVQKRRTGREQLDQVKAARDRLARSLAVVRRDLDEAMNELAAAVPEARAAMASGSRRVPESLDRRSASELAAQLDSARASGEPVVEIRTPPVDADDEAEAPGGSDQSAQRSPATGDSDAAGAADAASDANGEAGSVGSASAGVPAVEVAEDVLDAGDDTDVIAQDAAVVADIDALFDRLAHGTRPPSAIEEGEEQTGPDGAPGGVGDTGVSADNAEKLGADEADADGDADEAAGEADMADVSAAEATADEGVDESAGSADATALDESAASADGTAPDDDPGSGDVGSEDAGADTTVDDTELAGSEPSTTPGVDDVEDLDESDSDAVGGLRSSRTSAAAGAGLAGAGVALAGSGDEDESAGDDTASSHGDDAEAGSVDAATDDEDSDGKDSDGKDSDDESEIDLPEVFLARDVAITRFGPDLRRQLKRALADDQSAVLDSLRRAKGNVSPEDLPALEVTQRRFADALLDAARGLAGAGAATVDAEAPTAEIDELAERYASTLASPLRDRVERAVNNADGDRADALDPIRAHYRDARSTDLPSLADDILADAFALGVFHGLPEGVEVAWVADPRSEPGPDCFDNTLAGSVVKGVKFPTGHRLPPGSVGCRCLVVQVPLG